MSHVVDASARTLRSVSQEIKEAISQDVVTLRNAQHLHGLAAGLKSGEVRIEGDAGDYLAVLNDGASIQVEGNAGRYLADNMTAGSVVVNGSAGAVAAPYCYGGLVWIAGDAGDFTGVMNKGATIFVGGNVGDEVATYMLAGKVILLGNAGQNLGNYLIRGEIFIAGSWESLGHNTRVLEMDPADLEMLNRLFEDYQVEAGTSSFKKIERLSEKPFYQSKPSLDLQQKLLVTA